MCILTFSGKLKILRKVGSITFWTAHIKFNQYFVRKVENIEIIFIIINNIHLIDIQDINRQRSIRHNLKIAR